MQQGRIYGAGHTGPENAAVLIRSQKNLFGLFFLDYDGDFEENIKNGLINSMVVIRDIDSAKTQQGVSISGKR